MARTKNIDLLQCDFIDMLKATGSLKNKAIEHALQSTPRHLFVDRIHALGNRKGLIEVDPKCPTPDQLKRIYSDEALLSHLNPPSSTSQPSLVVHMLDVLSVRAGHRVFEIGAGTGWNAALLAHLAGPDGQVVTMDIQSDVTRRARRHLKRQDTKNVSVITGDASKGYAKEAPFDRLITTVTCPTLFPAWWEQLSPKGIMVLTLNDFPGESHCLMLKLQKRKDHLSGKVISLPGFMLFTGKHGMTLQWDQARKLVEEFAGKRPAAKERASWADILDGRGSWTLRRDLAFFAQLQGLTVIPMQNAFVLTTHNRSNICIIHKNHITAYGGRECFDKLKEAQTKWLHSDSPSRQDYCVEVWPNTVKHHRPNSWELRHEDVTFIFSLK